MDIQGFNGPSAPFISSESHSRETSTSDIRPQPLAETHDVDFWSNRRAKFLLMGGVGGTAATASGSGTAWLVASALGAGAITGTLPAVIGTAIVVTLIALTILGLVAAGVGLKRAYEAHQQLQQIQKTENRVENDSLKELYLSPAKHAKEAVVQQALADLKEHLKDLKSIDFTVLDLNEDITEDLLKEFEKQSKRPLFTNSVTTFRQTIQQSEALYAQFSSLARVVYGESSGNTSLKVTDCYKNREAIPYQSKIGNVTIHKKNYDLFVQTLNEKIKKLD